LTVVDVGDADQIGRDIASFAKIANGGLIVTANQFGATHPHVIVAAAERHKLPAVYSQPCYIAAGGLICYGSAGWCASISRDQRLMIMPSGDRSPVVVLDHDLHESVDASPISRPRDHIPTRFQIEPQSETNREARPNPEQPPIAQRFSALARLVSYRTAA
jgi:hypothetical protein